MYLPNIGGVNTVMAGGGGRGAEAIGQALSRMAMQRVAAAEQAARMRAEGVAQRSAAIQNSVAQASSAIENAMKERVRNKLQQAALQEDIRKANMASADRAADRKSSEQQRNLDRLFDTGRTTADLLSRWGLAGMERESRGALQSEELAARERMAAAENESRERTARNRKGIDETKNPYDFTASTIIQQANSALENGVQPREVGKMFLSRVSGILPNLTPEARQTVEAMAASLGISFPSLQSGGQPQQPVPWYESFRSGRTQPTPPVDPNSIAGMLGIGAASRPTSMPTSQPIAPFPGSRPTYEQAPKLTPDEIEQLDRLLGGLR